MKNFINILKKEIKELVTKQMILSLVVMVMMFGMLGTLMGAVQEESQKPISLAFWNLDKSEASQNFLERLSKNQGITMEDMAGENLEEVLAQTAEKELKALLVIPVGFGQSLNDMSGANVEIYSLVQNLGLTESASSAALVALIRAVNEEITASFIQKSFPAKTPQGIMNPVQTKEYVVAQGHVVPGNPATVSALATSQSIMIPLLLMTLIMYAGTMITTSMGLEKENKTLETLLTLPVKRISIILGKMGGAMVAAMLMVAIFIGGFGYYMSSITSTAPTQENLMQQLGLTFNALDYILLGTSLFLAILIALSACMILGLFAQDAKSAHTLNLPIIFMVIIPFYILMFMDLETMPMALKTVLYIIPFSHPIIASKMLIFHHYPTVIGGIAYLAVFACATMYLAIRLFNTDKIMTAKFSFRRKKLLNGNS